MEENPFVYRSKVPKYVPTKKAEQATPKEKAPVKKFKLDLSAAYEAHYDVEQLEDIAVYNQFGTTIETNEETSPSWWQNLVERVKHLTHKKAADSQEEATEQVEMVAEEVQPVEVAEQAEVTTADDLASAEVAERSEPTAEIVEDSELEESVAEIAVADDATVTPVESQVVAEPLSTPTITEKSAAKAAVEKVTDDVVDEVAEIVDETDEVTEVETIDKVANMGALDEATSEPEVDLEATQVVDLTALQEEQPAKKSFSQRASRFWQTSLNQVKHVAESVGHSTQHLEEAVQDKSVEIAEHIVEDLDTTRVLSTEQIRAYSDELVEATQVFVEPILTDQVLEEYLNEDDVTISAELQEKQSIAKGATWLAIGNMVSRILGAIYIIPWAAWLGAEYTTSNILYAAGYTPYALFLAVSTAGFPSAIAKQVAYHHSRKEYKTASRLFKYSLMIMSLMGLVSALLMFVSAPLIIQHSAVEDVEAGVAVVRSLVPALLILPVMSLLRGYFQGFNDMMPTAVSQILEQIARVGYMLVTTYAITQMMHGSASTAVVHSTFAAFIGAVVALAYLIFVYLRYLPMIKGLMAEDQTVEELALGSALRVMLKDSIPFILLGSGIIIAQVIDQFTLQPILRLTTSLLDTEIGELFGVINLDTNKLIMIIISLAIGIAMSSLPAITKRHAEGDKRATGELIEHTVLLFSIVMLPAAIGMASIAKPVYQMFYANGSQYGPDLLVTASYMSIVLGAYTILSTIVQAMDFRRKSMKYLLGGLVVKFGLQFPLLALMQVHGALVATAIGFGVSTAFMWRRIHRSVTIQYVDLVPQLAKILLATLVMGMTTYFWSQALAGLLGDVGRLMTFVKVFLIVIVGVAIYGVILGLFGLLHLLIGKRYQALQDKMRLF